MEPLYETHWAIDRLPKVWLVGRGSSLLHNPGPLGLSVQEGEQGVMQNIADPAPAPQLPALLPVVTTAAYCTLEPVSRAPCSTLALRALY